MGLRVSWRVGAILLAALLATALSRDTAALEAVAPPAIVNTSSLQADSGWRPMNAAGAPSPCRNPTAVWTGENMIVWGGDDGAVSFGDGARYDPATDRWSPISSEGAPSPRSGHTAVWTGAEMVVWGGLRSSEVLGDGVRYDPFTDSWKALSPKGAPRARREHVALWTGREMIVWGGFDGAGYLGDGDRYDPLTDSWAPVPPDGAPQARSRHSAVWTGKEMVVWGGWQGPSSASFFGDGGRYDPDQDAWTPIPAHADLPGRAFHAAVWTGQEMIVVGGASPDVGHFDVHSSGARFDLETGRWAPLSPRVIGGGTGGIGLTAVWTGSELLVWGGDEEENSLRDGGLYRSWKPGDERSILRLSRFSTYGARYDPETDFWRSLSSLGAPSARGLYAAVWTGREMILWGGWGRTGFTVPEQVREDGFRLLLPPPAAPPQASETLPCQIGEVPALGAGDQIMGTWNIPVCGRVGPGRFNQARSAASDSEGNLYVADTWNHRIQRLSPEGQPLAVWGGKGAGPGQFDAPHEVAVDHEGNIYVADTLNHRVQKLSPSGEPLSQWGGEGREPGQFRFASNLALDSEGTLYVVDSWNSRVQKLSPSGEVLAQFGTGERGKPGYIAGPHGVGVDGEGNVYVSDLMGNAIQRFAPSGEPMERWGSAGLEPGQFQVPRGLAVDAQGNLYVIDGDNDRIQKLTRADDAPRGDSGSSSAEVPEGADSSNSGAGKVAR